jgi:glycine cleavage system aminomethyltransferase T
VCLILDDETIPLHGSETIWRDGKCLGLVKSTAYGHTIGKTIAYGYVDATIADIPKVTNKWLKEGKW